MNINLTPLMNFCNNVLTMLGNALMWLLDALCKLLWGVLYVIIDGLLSIVEGIISAIDVSTILTKLAEGWGLIPCQIVWVIQQINLAQCIAIIGYAIGIRKLLDLIPAAFTRV